MFVIPVPRPLRFLVFALGVGAFLQARHGDVFAALIATACAALLWGRPMLAVGAWVRDLLRL